MYTSVISKHYEKFLKAISNEKAKICHPDITFQIFYDIFKIRDAQREYNSKVKRGINHTLSEIFQDIIAHYLRRCLNSEKYELILEYNREGKPRPDILIKKKGKNWAVIEIKTTIGWNRNLIKNNEYKKRLKKLSKKFKVSLKRTFYIFESSSNVNKNFSEEYRKKKKSEITKYILPLFEYMVDRKYLPRKLQNKELSDKKLFEVYKSYKISSFDKIIKKIK